jgi:hypothetical protein
MRPDPRCAVGPDDIGAATRPRGDTGDDALALALDEAIEDHLAAALAFVIGALMTGLFFTRLTASIDRLVRRLGDPAC